MSYSFRIGCCSRQVQLLIFFRCRNRRPTTTLNNYRVAVCLRIVIIIFFLFSSTLLSLKRKAGCCGGGGGIGGCMHDASFPIVSGRWLSIGPATGEYLDWWLQKNSTFIASVVSSVVFYFARKYKPVHIILCIH